MRSALFVTVRRKRRSTFLRRPARGIGGTDALVLKDELEKSREVGARHEHDVRHVVHHPADSESCAAAREIGEENIHAELSGSVSQSGIDVLAAKSLVGERDEHAAAAGNLFYRADHSVGEVTMPRNDCARL